MSWWSKIITIPSPVKWNKSDLFHVTGDVYGAKNKDSGDRIVVKKIRIAGDSPEETEAQIKKLEVEVQKLQNLKPHENVVKYLGTRAEGKTLYVLSEFNPGRYLSINLEYGPPIQEAEARIYTKQLWKGLKHLHDNGIIHGNIKAANILVESSYRGKIWLTDFGLSKESTVSRTKPASGYGSSTDTDKVAPENCQNLTDAEYFKKRRDDDLWNLGCVVIEMVTGNLLSPESEEVGAAVMKKDTDPPIPEHLSSDAKEFLNICLQREPADSGVDYELLHKHPFIKVGMVEALTQTVNVVAAQTANIVAQTAKAAVDGAGQAVTDVYNNSPEIVQPAARLTQVAAQKTKKFVCDRVEAKRAADKKAASHAVFRERMEILKKAGERKV